MSVKGRTAARIGGREFNRELVPGGLRLLIRPAMATNPLIVLRVVLPGQSSRRLLSAKVSRSHAHQIKFEPGLSIRCRGVMYLPVLREVRASREPHPPARRRSGFTDWSRFA